MAITARTAVYSGSPKTVDKEVTWDQAADAAIPISAFEEIDDLTCDFILNGHGYHGKNYMEVSWDNVVKYYFIESRSGMSGDRTKVRGVCDVLSTYKTSIQGAEAVINRTSYSTVDAYVDPMLRDNKVTTTSRTVVSSEVLQEDIIGDQEYFYVGIIQNAASTGTMQT